VTFSLTVQKQEIAGKVNSHPLKYQGPEAELPSGYLSDRLVAMFRDPEWLYCYWDFSPSTYHYIEDLKKQPFFLKAHTDGREFCKLPISPFAKSWFLHVDAPGKTVTLDLGVETENGYLVLLRSNQVTMPTGAVSPKSDEVWLSIDELYGEERYFRPGFSPEFWQKEGKRQYAEYVSSPMPMAVGPGFAHYLWLDTELIIFGKTTPNSVLKQNGQLVELNEDGTFSIRVKLNEGEQNLNFESLAKNGLSINKALHVERSLIP